MEEKIQTHRGYAEWVESGKKFKQYFGEYQHLFSSKKGLISMVQMINYLHEGDNFWEIFCLEGDLFEYTERFIDKKKAVERVRELLD